MLGGEPTERDVVFRFRPEVCVKAIEKFTKLPGQALVERASTSVVTHPSNRRTRRGSRRGRANEHRRA